MIAPDRLRALMEKTRDAADARDKALAKLQDRVSGDDDAVEHAVDYITGSFHAQLSQSAENAAKMATQVRAAGQGAESSHKKVKAMDARLSNVRSALSVVQAVVKQRSSVSKVSAAVHSGNFETAVDCIVQYDSVSRILVNFPATTDRAAGSKINKSHDGGDDSDGEGSTNSGSTGHPAQTSNTTFSFGDDSSVSSSALPPDETVNVARVQLHEALTSELDAACKAQLEPSVCRFASMLAKLGFADDGCDRFTKFVVGTVKADLDDFVSGALQDVQSGKTTHLVTCVSVLDRIASAMERHKTFMDDTFPGRSDSLILALHTEATDHGVDVLRDFLAARKGVVGGHGSTGKHGKNNKKREASVAPAAPASKADPRSLDQTLEDISHLLTCCHQYINFVAECVTSPLDPKKDNDRIQAVRAKIQNSPLLKEVSGLMNIYVPVQAEYLHAAFELMIGQCDEHLAAQLEPLRGALDEAASGGGFTESIMTSFWGGAGGGGAAGGTHPAASPTSTHPGVPPDLAPGTRKFEKLVHDLDVTLVEDLFHVLLIAIRRAAGTRDITIASATVNSVNAMLLEDLLPELRRRLVVDLESEKLDNTVSAAVRKALRLKWLCAAHNACEYTSKLALDCEHVAASNFSGKDMFRLSEQKHDFTQTATTMREGVTSRAKDCADAMASSILATARPVFEAANHVLQTETAYVNAGLADTWVTAMRPVFEEAIKPLAFPFPEAVRDTIVTSICGAATEWLEQTIPHKRFDAFGALQLDRELRDLRNLFANETETPIRDYFKRALAMSAVLMADSQQDAAAEAKGILEDPARLFQQRVDL